MTLFAYDAADAPCWRRRTTRWAAASSSTRTPSLGENPIVPDDTVLTHPFRTGDELLRLAQDTGLSISALMLENEKAWRTEDEIRTGLLEIWQVMQACVTRGTSREGILPGGLKVRRRAAHSARQLRSEGDATARAMEWTTLYAMAVNEENAAAWPGGDRPHQRRGRHHPRRPALLHQLRARRGRGRCRPLPARGKRHRHALQGERLHLRRRGRLPGRGRLGLLDGRRMVSPRSSAGPPSRSRTPPRSAWSTTSA